MKTPCCEVFPQICGLFDWYRLGANEETRVMPNIRVGGTGWRVNYCPSCGKEIRGVEVTPEAVADSREMMRL